ncbi:M4 family metallopeptidase [Archangium lansingense]|uniref:M4 family metallopeptidase n=1 Tax=Archangium lansingense TaxID=2995310 RepID=UPI003B7C6A73
MRKPFTRTVISGFGLMLAACTAVADVDMPDERTGGDSVQAALARFSDAQVVASDDAGPYFVRGTLGRVPKQVLEAAARHLETPELSASLDELAPVFRMGGDTLRFKRAIVDDQGHHHLRFQALKDGLPVVGGELILHVNLEGTIYAANGMALDDSQGPRAASLSPGSAIQAAVDDTSIQGAAPRGEPQRVYLRPDGARELRLAYQVEVVGQRDGLLARDLVYVDAQHGGILAVHPQIHSALSRRVYSTDNVSTLPGTLRRAEGQPAAGDTHVDTQYEKLRETYTCFQMAFGRDSFDNAGAQLISTVLDASNYVNAQWNGSQMVFGDGSPSQSLPLGLDLDVTTHEFTHAVTAHESSLIYSGESGGLNESLSDIFASACESWSRGGATDADVFKIGEDVWTPSISGDALRYMNDPARDGLSLDFYPDYSPGVDVHYSSGISNLAFYLLARGGMHPRGKTELFVEQLGIVTASRIFYKASTELFTASTTFEQAKTYTLQAAEALYGPNSYQKLAVRNAWAAVGLPVPPPCGNYVCDSDWGEWYLNCPQDCSSCGDGMCSLGWGDNSSNCPSDCYCGDGVCDVYEQQDSCPSDCTVEGDGYCGNGVCDRTENRWECDMDCH